MKFMAVAGTALDLEAKCCHLGGTEHLAASLESMRSLREFVGVGTSNGLLDPVQLLGHVRHERAYHAFASTSSR